MRKWVRKQFSKSAKDRSYEQRTIQLNDPHNRTNFCDNHIYSCRYNIFTFLPLNLWEQLHRPINIYFLLIAALQFIPSVAPVSPLTTIFPITVAFLVNTVKEGIDDVRRHQQDAEMNERVYQRVRHGTLELENVASADIRVGDVLILHPFEVAPSDVVILLTSHDSGSAHITTESLDGETGSKKRFAILHQLFKHSQASSSPIAVEPRFRGSTFGTTPTPDSDAAGVDASAAKAIEKRIDVPILDLPRCCNTVEDHQLHCLRYAYCSRVVLHSEGPNAQLHSYHGSATVCTPRSSLRTWRENRPLTRTTGSDTGDAVKERGATSDLSTGCCYGVVPAEAALPISADILHPQEADMTEAVQRHLLMPVMVPLLPCQRTARTVDSMMVESFSSSVDERSRLLESGGPSQASALLRQSLSQREAGAYDYFDGPEQTLPVTIDNVVYSSSRIGNTHFVIALVLFTGCDTKISMARNVLPTKWPTIDYRFNYLTMLIFLFQLILVLTCAFLACVHLEADATVWYLGGSVNLMHFSEYFLILPLRYLMMLSPMVPLSFKVMVEISKAYVSYVIRWDEDMRTEVESVTVNNSTLAEELGQVEYILSDKTGTLTANTMAFRVLATANDTVFSATTEDSIRSDLHRPLSEVGKVIKAKTVRGQHEDYYLMLSMTLCNTIEPTLSPPLSANGSVAYGAQGIRSSGASRTASTSFSSRWMSSSPDEVALVEGAEQCGFSLRRRSRTHGTVGLWGEAGASLEVEVVYTLPFSSERGMMSVLVRCPVVVVKSAETEASDIANEGTGGPPMHYVLLIKGSDEKVLPRCTDAYSASHFEDIKSRLAGFSRKGLRTLVYGYRILMEEEVKEALRRFTAVEASFTSAVARDAELQFIYALLERDCTYCGITAVKDELQEGVPQTLAQLRHANIRVWMLTGDKTETATQTAVACGLLTSADRIITLTPPNEDLLTPTDHLAYVSERVSEIKGLLAQEGLAGEMAMATHWQRVHRWCRGVFWERTGLEDFVHEFTHTATFEQIRPLDHLLATQPRSLIQARYGRVSPAVMDIVPKVCGAARREADLHVDSAFSASSDFYTGGRTRGFCVMLSGKTLRLLEREDVTSQGHSAVVRVFQQCLLQARAVVCSRTTPSLKSYVVDIVRRSGHITLAIGDGGNDVPMLQAAHVGVGVKGREGSQAQLASDFAIGQFRFLSRLILVHGHTAYQRTAMIVQQSFWKTVLIAWVQVLFNFSTDFSGVSYWDSFSLTLYNAIPTVPVTFLCVMDVPLSHWLLSSITPLYSMSQRGRYFNAITFYGYVARALLHGTMIYYLSVALQRGAGSIMANGWVVDNSCDFYVPYIAAVTVHTYTVLTESHAITIAHWFCFLFSIWTCFLSFWLYARTPASPNDTFLILLRSPSFYLSYFSLLTTVCVSLAIYAIPKMLWFPDSLQLVRLLLAHMRETQAWQRSLPAPVLRIFFQEDNPSQFWKSFSLYHALRYSPPPRQVFTVEAD